MPARNVATPLNWSNPSLTPQSRSVQNVVARSVRSTPTWGLSLKALASTKPIPAQVAVDLSNDSLSEITTRDGVAYLQLSAHPESKNLHNHADQALIHRWSSQG